jgi:tRNA/rRNA methyltransferase
VNCAYAFSARTRDLAPPLRTSGEAAAEVVQLFRAAHGADLAPPKVAFVFGAERSGLVNDEVMQCQRLCQIEANPEYNSLNLAQAVQVMTYSLRQAALHGDVVAPAPVLSQLVMLDAADLSKHEGMLAHWEQMLIKLEMVDPNIPTETMARLRALFARTQLSDNEVNFLRGIAGAVLKAK